MLIPGVGMDVGVSVKSDDSVGGISVEVGRAVSVGRRGADVGAGEEHEIRRSIEMTVSRTRDAVCGGI
jgi:hypothetical protein